MSYKLPFPTWTLDSEVTVYQTTRNDEGGFYKVELFKGACRHDIKIRTTMNAQREIVELSGLVVIPGNACAGMIPGHPLLIEIEGVEKRVYDMNLPKNPDKSIFSTELRLL